MDQADSVHSTPPTNTSPDRPTLAQEALYLPTDTTPEQIFQAIGRLRKEARDEIDCLIGFLDKPTTTCPENWRTPLMTTHAMTANWSSRFLVLPRAATAANLHKTSGGGRLH